MRRTISDHERIRRQRGYRVGELAEMIGVSSSYVSLVEGGLEPGSQRYRTAAAKALGVPEDLLFDTPAPTPRKTRRTPDMRTPGLAGRKGVRGDERGQSTA
jgi:transcriptional regulator with XRE-family HTH domain